MTSFFSFITFQMKQCKKKSQNKTSRDNYVGKIC